MGSKICMRENCAATTSLPEWKEGWSLKSGGLATLCYQCGSAYENFIFCETFHQEESGWRECKICGKQIHCGCIASKYMHDFLDSGGVGCIRCIRDLETRLVRPVQISSNDIPNGHGTSMVIGDENRVDGDNINKEKLMQLSRSAEENQPSYFPQPQKGDLDSSHGQIKQEENTLPSGEDGTGLLYLSQQCSRSSMSSKPDRGRPSSGIREMYESLAQPSSVFSYNSPLGMTNSVLHFPGGVVEGREKSKVPPMQQGQRARHILPKPPKSGTSSGSQANKGTVSHSQTRVARPPAEGRGRNQLLPRYWPRITDQELQQLSGDLNSTIVPLFEKVLSASDAGRIGRLVLPKACAEAYFPPISQSEGIPIRVQDIKGKEWTFQFRFWPNNNSRMYVLEGVTPCIQNMQLQAGDTVTFSRIDPGGKLVMGFRRATNSVDMQESQTCPLSNGGLSGETLFSGVSESLLTETFGWKKNETRGGMTNEDLLQRSMLISEKKKTRNIGSKSKRLLMHNEDAMELRITWEDAQELLCPPPSAKPTIVMVENYEFEEYDEPPVFGKRTIFTARASGEQEQWAQCDSCSKWRRLPANICLPPKWTCSDNIWDSNRSSCSAPGEINPKKLENGFRASKDFKKRRITENKLAQECEPSGLDALATAAVLGDNVEDPGEPSIGATTRHPRHRPGCTCIVCIQPPSGKGKHKPTCMCNVCLTVKRRFETLMLRKKKRQSEREAEIAKGKIQIPQKEEVETGSPSEPALLLMNHLENGIKMEVGETSMEHLDLNFNPNRDEDLLLAEGMSLTTLVQAAGLPLEMYLGQNGLPNVDPCILPNCASESERHHPDEGCVESIDAEQEHVSMAEQENKNKGDEG